MDNRQIARKLLEYAQVLDAREANLFRVRAYRRAAETVMALDKPLVELVAAKGRAGLEALPGIGPRLSNTLSELLRTGEFRALDAENEQSQPKRILRSLPGVGRRLAQHIYEQLGITTLEEVEQAAHDGRLSRIGLGPKQVRSIRDAVAGRLSLYRFPPSVSGEPSVAHLLQVDQEYRRRAEKSKLPTITPRRFNPRQESWLPIYETRRGGWRYRALFSNTALAHRLGQTRDWVVISFEQGPIAGQRTVITESRGELRGRRIIRGREEECRHHYDSSSTEESHHARESVKPEQPLFAQ
jgi:hypothetical protein